MPKAAQHWILIFGNPIDGYEHIGPFPTAEAATQYADRWLRSGGDWWITVLQKPAKGDDHA